jgi:chaperonin cofactor prefoldin
LRHLDLSTALISRQKLDSQFQETGMVIKVCKYKSIFIFNFNLKELNLLSTDCLIFKAIGPALILQETDDSLSNLKKRQDYINSEMYTK